MLNRYWSRTSGGAQSGVPFGPLRYRAWTSRTGAQPAQTSVPFGPIRFRGWTSGEGAGSPGLGSPGGSPTEPVVVPPSAFVTGPIKIDLRHTRRILREDEELVTLLLALAASGALDGKGRN